MPVAEVGAEAVESLLASLADRGRAERGRFIWHSSGRYVAFLAEFFLRRSNRSTVARFLPGFLEAFPSIESLSLAHPDAVVAEASWAGLRRRVARLPEIASTFASKATWTADELLELPHIGRYAAQGIALYVFDEPMFPIDNNVRRVIGRYLDLPTESEIEEVASSLVVRSMTEGGIERLRDAHRGALALGWEPCSTRPRCAECALSSCCAAYTRAAGPHAAA